MKKLKTAVLVFLLIQIIFADFALADSPYQTYIYSTEGEYTLSQNTYRPEQVYYEGLARPEDVFIQDGIVYIADSGNGEIVLLSCDTGELMGRIGGGLLAGVTGVFADEESIFAAVPEAGAVYRFDQDGRLLQTYGKPDSPLFGKNEPYKPKKVASDVRGNVYVIGEGATNGIIQLDSAGGFGGYFGVNQTTISFNMLMQRMFFTDSQKSNIFQNRPPSPNNIAVDSGGIVYTVTESAGEAERIKKLNIAGQNVFQAQRSLEGPADIAVDMDGNVYTISSSGQIMVYDSFGNELYKFGNQFNSTDKTGVFKQASGIAVGADYRLYVTDRENASITVLEPTQIADTIFAGVRLYKDGRYVESMEPWRQTLVYNSGYALAHKAMGKAYFRLQNYESALYEYELANDIGGYSEAFWELRNQWIQTYIPAVLLIFVLLWIMKKAFDFWDRKQGIYRPLRMFWGRFCQTRFYQETNGVFLMLRHPIDCCYQIKRLHRGRWPGFFIITAWWVLETVLFAYGTSYIFSGTAKDDINIFQTIGVVLAPLSLWIVSNYLISSITEGEGSFRETAVYSVTAWSPLYLFGLPLALLTNVLTLNEAFIYQFIYMALIIWSLVNLCICIKEVHNYTGREVIKNIFLTLFTMIMLALALFIVYILTDQVVQFIITFR